MGCCESVEPLKATDNRGVHTLLQGKPPEPHQIPRGKIGEIPEEAPSWCQ